MSKVSKSPNIVRAIAHSRWRRLSGATETPVYLDIGARGGLPQRWQWAQKAGLISPVFVEAEPQEASRLSRPANTD